MATDDISFIDAEVQRCPFAAYARLREQDPVYYDASCEASASWVRYG